MGKTLICSNDMSSSDEGNESMESQTFVGSGLSTNGSVLQLQVQFVPCWRLCLNMFFFVIETRATDKFKPDIAP